MKRESLDDVSYLLSETDPAKLGPCAAEVTFVGRSNVGKSTLINSVCRKTLARVSNTPGRTRTINVFLAGIFVTVRNVVFEVRYPRLLRDVIRRYEGGGQSISVDQVP